MARIPQPVAGIRLAVRRCFTAVPAGSLVLVACSGGADSLALAAATAFVAPRLGLRAGLATVDHGLQAGSAERPDTRNRDHTQRTGRDRVAHGQEGE